MQARARLDWGPLTSRLPGDGRRAGYSPVTAVLRVLLRFGHAGIRERRLAVDGIYITVLEIYRSIIPNRQRAGRIIVRFEEPIGATRRKIQCQKLSFVLSVIARHGVERA